MFAWLNLPLIRKELTALSESIAKVRAEIAEILISAEREKDEAVAFVKSEVAKATEELTSRIVELETKVEDLMTQPPGELDVSGILEDLATLKVKVETIIVPDAVEPTPDPEPEAEIIPVDGEFDEEEFDDVPTVILDPEAPPAEDVVTVEPEA
jgi:hypothetical protein